MSRPRLIALLLALITLAVYMPVTRHSFLTYDDDEYVTSNQHVRNGLTFAGIEWAFTAFHSGNWHPLTWVSHMTDCEFFGLDPAGHHLVNVLFHAANVALLFILLWRITQQIWPAALVAALFAWHPLHVESVAWIAERKDVLSTFFALLALLSYARFVKESNRRSYWFALVFFALGLLAKPMLVSLPVIMLLLDFWPFRRLHGNSFPWPLIREKIPFILLAAGSCVVTFLAQQKSHAVASLDQIPLSFRLENAPVATARYLLKLFWPGNMAVIYPLASLQVMSVVMAVTVVILLSAGVWWLRKRSPCLLMGWLWFLVTLLPVIGLVQVGSAAMADRYTYIPSIGIFIAVAFGLDTLCGSPRRRSLFHFGSVLLLVACVVLTEHQLRYWRNSETLFRHALAVTKNNDIAHDNLGVALELQGRTVEALAEYREAVRVNPAHYQLHFSIGNMLDKLGQPAEALAEYRLCLRHNPEVPALHNAAGGALLALGQPDKALVEFTRAAQLDPHYVAPYLGSAKALLLLGRDNEAISQLQAALRVDPGNFEVLAYAAHVLAANENASARDGQKALALARKANDLSGGVQPMVLDILAMAYAETGDFTNAVTCAQNAVELASQANLKSTEAIRQRLELYKNRQPWRESFRTNAAPAQAK